MNSAGPVFGKPCRRCGLLEVSRDRCCRLHGFFSRGQVNRVLFLQVHAQHELGGDSCRGVVKGRVAVVMLKLFKPPAVQADDFIPELERLFTREVIDVVPTARAVLGCGDGLGGAV